MPNKMQIGGAFAIPFIIASLLKGKSKKDIEGEADVELKKQLELMGTPSESGGLGLTPSQWSPEQRERVSSMYQQAGYGKLPSVEMGGGPVQTGPFMINAPKAEMTLPFGQSLKEQGAEASINDLISQSMARDEDTKQKQDTMKFGQEIFKRNLDAGGKLDQGTVMEVLNKYPNANQNTVATTLTNAGWNYRDISKTQAASMLKNMGANPTPDKWLDILSLPHLGSEDIGALRDVFKQINPDAEAKMASIYAELMQQYREGKIELNTAEMLILAPKLGLDVGVTIAGMSMLKMDMVAMMPERTPEEINKKQSAKLKAISEIQEVSSMWKSVAKSLMYGGAGKSTGVASPPVGIEPPPKKKGIITPGAFRTPAPIKRYKYTPSDRKLTPQ